MTEKEMADALAEPFPADEVKWKPQGVKANRAMAVAYIDARCVMDRLDDICGVGGWQDAYADLPDHNIRCSLSIRTESGWVTKCDVGCESEQPDGGDRCKAAHSDALKRAAVKFGVGRYLYSLPKQWVDYDTVKKRITTTPNLPSWALPAAPTAAPKQATPAAPAQQAKPAAASDIATRAVACEDQWVAAGYCRKGELVAHLESVLRAPLTQWDNQDETAIREAMGAFVAPRRAALLTRLRDEIDQAVTDKGTDWAALVAAIALPDGITLTAMTRDQAERALDWLRGLPIPYAEEAF